MITYLGENTYDFRGLSTDKKPVNDKVGNGSTFLEIDTGKVFLFDKKSKAWIELTIGGGGGGGGDVDGRLITSAELLLSDPDNILTLNLRNKDGLTIASASVDLPTEFILSSGYFDLETNEIVLILADEEATEIRIPVGALVTNIQNQIDAKQDKLVSGTNIKTVHGQSILGSGDIDIVGPQGPTGHQGNIGPTGAKGDQGIQGLTGPTGAEGKLGPTGLQGEQGAQGPTGADGPEGRQGPTGPQGEDGAIGPTGPKGEDGKEGPTGQPGADGQPGAVGPIGPTGADGLTTAISVNGETYEQVEGTITLPDYPEVNEHVVEMQGIDDFHDAPLYFEVNNIMEDAHAVGIYIENLDTETINKLWDELEETPSKKSITFTDNLGETWIFEQRQPSEEEEEIGSFHSYFKITFINTKFKSITFGFVEVDAETGDDRVVVWVEDAKLALYDYNNATEFGDTCFILEKPVTDEQSFRDAINSLGYYYYDVFINKFIFDSDADQWRDPSYLIDNFGETWYIYPTSENSCDLTIIINNEGKATKISAGISFNIDAETGDLYLSIATITLTPYTSVIANDTPESWETPTDLTSLRVDGTLYSISGGEGSGSVDDGESSSNEPPLNDFEGFKTLLESYAIGDADYSNLPQDITYKFDYTNEDETNHDSILEIFSSLDTEALYKLFLGGEGNWSFGSMCVVPMIDLTGFGRLIVRDYNNNPFVGHNFYSGKLELNLVVEVDAETGDSLVVVSYKLANGESYTDVYNPEYNPNNYSLKHVSGTIRLVFIPAAEVNNE